MASLPFISCWCKYIFLIIIQILTEKSISSNVWIAEPLNMADLSFFSFLRDLHTDHPLVASTYTKNIKKDWMGLDIGVIHPIQTSGSEDRAVQGLEIGGPDVSKKFSHTLQTLQTRTFCQIARICVKLNFRKWKVSVATGLCKFWIINKLSHPFPPTRGKLLCKNIFMEILMKK